MFPAGLPRKTHNPKSSEQKERQAPFCYLNSRLPNKKSLAKIKSDRLVLNGGAMKNRERTRLMIVEPAAPVFNAKGYYGSSMRDLVEKTGFEKGGIYNHFGSKEDLADGRLHRSAFPGPGGVGSFARLNASRYLANSATVSGSGAQHRYRV